MWGWFLRDTLEEPALGSPQTTCPINKNENPTPVIQSWAGFLACQADKPLVRNASRYKPGKEWEIRAVKVRAWNLMDLFTGRAAIQKHGGMMRLKSQPLPGFEEEDTCNTDPAATSLPQERKHFEDPAAPPEVALEVCRVDEWFAVLFTGSHI